MTMTSIPHGGIASAKSVSNLIRLGNGRFLFFPFKSGLTEHTGKYMWGLLQKLTKLGHLKSRVRFHALWSDIYTNLRQSL